MIERNIISSSSDSTISILDDIFYVELPSVEGDHIVIIDSNGVELENEYEYKVRNSNNDDTDDLLYSIAITDTLYHHLSIPKNLSINQTGAKRTVLSWDYNHIIKDSTALSSFIIQRTSTNNDIESFEVPYQNTELIDSMLTPYTSYTYSIKAKTLSDHYSNADTISLYTEFPILSYQKWVPNSLSKIHLQYSVHEKYSEFLFQYS